MLKRFLLALIVVVVFLSIFIFPAEVSAIDKPVLPEGDAYKISANEIAPFKTGDIISLTLKVTDIKATGGLLGLDLDVVYDPIYLVPVKKTNGKPDVISSASSIMAKYESSKWTSTIRWDGQSTSTPTLVLKLFSDADIYSEEPQREVSITNDGELWFTIKFQAVKDSDSTGNMIAYTSGVAGTDINANGIYGKGITINTKGTSTPAPTQVPTPVPTQKPSPVPTQAPTAVRLKVQKKPTKLVYNPGEDFTYEGIELLAIMSDGTSKTVSADNCAFMGFDSSKEGVQKIYVSYLKVQCYFSIRVETPYIRALKIYQKPNKLYYDYGEAIDLTGLKISAVYSSGKIEELCNDEIRVYGYDCSAIGVQQVILMYQGVKASYSVRVQNSVVGLILAAKPDKLNYGLGEEFSYAGLQVNAKYADGTTEPISNTRLVYTGFNNSEAGVHVVTVTYGKFSKSFSVRVNESASLKSITLTKPSKLRYAIGEELDLTGMAIVGVYTDGSLNPVDLSEVVISGFDNSHIGVQQLAVSYRNFTRAFSVAVYE